MHIATAPKYNVAYHQETKEIQHHLVHQLGKYLYFSILIMQSFKNEECLDG